MGRVEIGRDLNHRAIILEYSDEWSFKNFSNQRNIFAGRGKELDGLTIYSTSFYQEALDVDIFPSDVKNLVLAFCNLDNVVIPRGSTLIECSTRRIKVQNDLRDWELDDNDQPIKLINEEYWKQQGYFTDPALIPAMPVASIDDIKPVNPSIDVIPVGKEEPEAQKLAAVLQELLKRPDLETSRKELTDYVDYVLGKAAVEAIKAGG
ncbi:MAG: hypothetical protein PHC88_05610 [Terrimicrobiaceae bacterium]|nr:hypothetical protein [Terrimicrobiaceae bacterium]